MLLSLLLLLSISIVVVVVFTQPPQCSCPWGLMKPSCRKVLGTWDVKMLLSTWALHRLSKRWRMKARLQASLTWDMVSGEWRWAGNFKAVPLAERTQWHLVRSMRALSSRHAVIIPGSTQQGANFICISKWCGSWCSAGDDRGGFSSTDYTVCKSQRNPSIVLILVHLKGCLMVVMGALSKSWTNTTWCTAKGSSCWDGVAWTQLCSQGWQE